MSSPHFTSSPDLTPHQVILAFYYTLADIVLLGQCFYYRGFTFSDAPTKPAESTTPPSTEAPDESSALLGARRRSSSSFPNLDSAHHLSPATPLIDASKPGDPPATRPASTFQTFLSNTIALSLVCLAGVFGWWLSTPRHPSHGSTQDTSTEDLAFSVPGQIFGYLCAALYLGSRVPQILLNYRRKSTDGVSLLFFLFACVGNLTYVLSILAYAPVCRRGRDCGASELRLLYGRYILVNASWLLGSLGTLLLDLAIFVQFFLYRSSETASADH